jgi:hypothetical protein
LHLLLLFAAAAAAAGTQKKCTDVSAEYIKGLIATEPQNLNDATDLERELNSALPGKIIVSPGIFPMTDILPLVERNQGSEVDTDKISSVLRNGYEKDWIAGSEIDVTVVSYALTVSVWTDLGGLANSLFLKTGQNLSDGSTTARLRPDLCLWIKGALLLKGEVKESALDLDKAKQELVTKMNGWNSIALRGLPFLPCFAVGGNRIQFCAIFPPLKEGQDLIFRPVSEEYDMLKPIHRLSIFRISLNMLRVLAFLRNRLPEAVPALYAKILRRVGHITIMDDFVIKVCIPAADEVYEALQPGKGLPCAVTVHKVVKQQDGLVRLEIRPVCIEVLPSSLDDLRSAVINVLRALVSFHERKLVHRDLRWPNVLKSLDGWLVSDFELAAAEGTPVPPNAISPAYLPPELRLGDGAGYSREGDIFCVGRLLTAWEGARHTILPDAVRMWSQRLTADNPTDRPSALQLISERGTWLIA